MQSRKNGREYLLQMSPDKVINKAGDFGSHMGLDLAYVSSHSVPVTVAVTGTVLVIVADNLFEGEPNACWFCRQLFLRGRSLPD